MTPAWVDAAKGIPVWARASVIVPEHDARSRSERSQMIALDTFEDGRWRVLQTLPEVIYLYGGADLIPDLTDPDTRAMYRRRLAIAWGCPESAANEGVRFYRKGAFWHLYAGFADTPTTSAWRYHFDAVSDDPCLALALAWPADRRIHGG